MVLKGCYLLWVFDDNVCFLCFFYFKSVSAIDLSAGRGFILKSLVIANHVTEI